MQAEDGGDAPSVASQARGTTPGSKMPVRLVQRIRAQPRAGAGLTAPASENAASGHASAPGPGCGRP